MILSLQLSNFIIVSQLDLEFHSGMNIFTGETGAGKSIIIDAISLALGKRPEGKVVRENCEKSTITLCVDIRNNSSAQTWLKQHDVYHGDECILRRIIRQDGRSRGFINGEAVTLQALQNLGKHLLTIHGQHQTIGLMQKQNQLTMLDRYAQHETLISQVQSLAHQWQQKKKKLDSIEKSNKDAEQKRGFLRFQLDELATLALQPNEVEQLNEEIQLLNNKERFITKMQQTIELLSEADQSIQSQLYRCQTLLSSNHINQTCQNILALLNQATILVDEATDITKASLNLTEFSPEHIEMINQRLATIQDLARKHKVPAEQLPIVETQLQKELATLDKSATETETLQHSLTQCQQNYQQYAQKLSQSRTKAAQTISEQISKDLHRLNMPESKFSIKLIPNTNRDPNQYGQENVEFCVAINSDQSLHPLAQAASGGELSRIHLAIQVNTAQRYQTPTLIFDEIDTGIGGATAEIVGNMLKQLALNTQIICVTHLPQVAAKANHHFKVIKQIINGETFTQIKYLNQNETVEEIARMLGGIKIGQQTLAQARFLLEETSNSRP